MEQATKVAPEDMLRIENAQLKCQKYASDVVAAQALAKLAENDLRTLSATLSTKYAINWGTDQLAPDGTIVRPAPPPPAPETQQS